MPTGRVHRQRGPLRPVFRPFLSDAHVDGDRRAVRCLIGEVGRLIGASLLVAEGAVPPPVTTTSGGYEFGDSQPTTTTAPATPAPTFAQVRARCDAVISRSLGVERTRWYLFGAFAALALGAAALARRPRTAAAP
jgi:hypothetical protein